MKALLTTTIFWLTVLTASAQYTFVKQWDKRFGGENTDILSSFQQTYNNGFILGGYSDSDNNGDKSESNWNLTTNDFWIVKIDSIGNKLWDKRFGGTNQDL